MKVDIRALLLSRLGSAPKRSDMVSLTSTDAIDKYVDGYKWPKYVYPYHHTEVLYAGGVIFPGNHNEDLSENIIVNHYAGWCRDSFFCYCLLSLGAVTSDVVKIAIVIDKSDVKRVPKVMEDWLHRLRGIPFVENIKWRVIGEANTTTYAVDGIKKINSYNVDISFIEVVIPYQLFADITTIWSMTLLLREEFVNYDDEEDGPNEYLPIAKKHIIVLRKHYYDIILTDKLELIREYYKELYNKYIDAEEKSTGEEFIMRFLSNDGPYGTCYATRDPHTKKTVKMFHKYVELDLFNSTMSKYSVVSDMLDEDY